MTKKEQREKIVTAGDYVALHKGSWRLLVGLCSTAIVWMGYTEDKQVYGCYGYYGSLQYLCSTAADCSRYP